MQKPLPWCALNWSEVRMWSRCIDDRDASNTDLCDTRDAYEINLSQSILFNFDFVSIFIFPPKLNENEFRVNANSRLLVQIRFTWLLITQARTECRHRPSSFLSFNATHVPRLVPSFSVDDDWFGFHSITANPAGQFRHRWENGGDVVFVMMWCVSQQIGETSKIICFGRRRWGWKSMWFRCASNQSFDFTWLCEFRRIRKRANWIEQKRYQTEKIHAWHGLEFLSKNHMFNDEHEQTNEKYKNEQLKWKRYGSD